MFFVIGVKASIPFHIQQASAMLDSLESTKGVKSLCPKSG
jgi:hypothetical protein